MRAIGCSAHGDAGHWGAAKPDEARRRRCLGEALGERGGDTADEDRQGGPPTVAVARAHRHEGGEGEIEYEVVEQAESVGAVAEGRQAVHDARQVPPPLALPRTRTALGSALQAPVGMPGKPSNALHRKPAIATGGSGGGSGRPLRHQYRRRLPPPGTRTEAYGSAPRRTILFPDDEKPTEDMAPTNGFVVRGWRNAIGTISSKTRPRLHSVIPSQGIRPDEHQDKDANTPKGVMS